MRNGKVNLLFFKKKWKQGNFLFRNIYVFEFFDNCNYNIIESLKHESLDH